MTLRKEDILKGVNDPELIMIESLGGELPLRPLSKKEWNQIEKIEAKAYGKFEASEKALKGRRQHKKSQLNTKGIIDLEKQNEAEITGKTEALCLSMNNSHLECDNWSKEEIQGLKNDAFEEIFKAVQRLSGIKVEEDEEDDDMGSVGDLEKEIDAFPGD